MNTSETQLDVAVEELLRKAPKAQLHLHLDGSLSFEFITRALGRLRSRNNNIDVFGDKLEPASEEELVQWFRKLKRGEQEKGWKVESSKNWNIFTICNYFLQTREDLTDATCDIVMRLALQHNVNYTEIRFAPVLHTNEGLAEEEAIRAVAEGFDNAVELLREQDMIVYGGIIICGLRSYPPSKLLSTVKMMKSVNNSRVVGFDIAGDERSYPLSLFEDCLRYAANNGINLTVHAGEWKEGCHDNLKLAVDLGVRRIGHGLALGLLRDDDDIFAKMRSNNISIEVCLTGNCSHPSKCASFSEHPLPIFIQRGVSIASLNVDNLLLSGNDIVGCPNPTLECVRALTECGLTKNQLLEVVEGGYVAAFAAVPPSFVDDSVRYWRENVLNHL